MMPAIKREKEKKFKAATLSHFKARGRHSLPWRVTQTPYRVLVSELMLQQTQVERVVPKFNAFVKAFPDVESLARASLSAVYKQWSGLGYNRRAKYLRDAAHAIAKSGGVIKDDLEYLRALPGIGPYTAGAIRAFAYGHPEPFIETNIRTAVLHHFFPKKKAVRDEEILAILSHLKPTKGKVARDWYAALMDYGAHLKKNGVRLNAQSRGYTKQTKFEGSLRQVRGAIMRELGKGGVAKAPLQRRIGKGMSEVTHALAGLIKNGLVQRRGTTFYLAK